mgnify:CR=1 FL=1
MLKNRIIPCLDVKNGRVVKGINFVNLVDAGDPVEQAKIYDEQGADELCFLDITASNENRNIILDTVKKTAEKCFMPLTVGGGVRTLEDIRCLLLAGADKVSINTAALKEPSFIEDSAKTFGSSTIVIAIEASKYEGTYLAFTDNGREYTGKSVVEWAKELESIAKELPLLEEQLSTRQNEKLDWIVAFTPQVFLHQCIKYTCDLVDAKRKKGQLPVKYNEIFYNDLLKKGECICGTSISDNTAAKENIRKWHDVVKEDERLDAAVEASADFRSILKSLPSDVGKIDEFRREVDRLIETIRKMRARKKEIELNLKGIDEKEIEVLREEYGAKETIKSDLDTEIAGLKVEIIERERLRNLARTDYNKVLKANVKKNEAVDKLEVSQTLIDSFEEVIKTVTKKLRESVGETTKNNFFNLIGKKKGFKNVSLNEDYRLTVTAEDKAGNIYDATGNLSAGEKLCLALSYISAIKDMTGYQMPLIIDTPLGKIAGRPKTFIGQRLPNFLSNTQLTLLVTDKEYQSSVVNPEDPTKFFDTFRKTIKESVNKEYLLVYDEEKKSTSFKPMPEMR